MHKFISARKSRGTGLIEVMLSIAILSIGLASMARLHTTVVKESIANASRAIAYNIASAKLEDLRSFGFRDQDDIIEVGASLTCGDDAFCFSDIGNNQGGKLPPGQVAGQSEFTLSWTVTSPSSKAGAPAKDVYINVTWSDVHGGAGATETLTLEAVLFPNDNLASNYARLGDLGEPGGGALTPKVKYTKNAVPDAIAIDIGGNLFAEANKPLPTIQGTGSTEVYFSNVNFKASGTQDFLVTQEEFTTVSCSCQFDTPGAAWTPFRMVFSSATNTLVRLDGKLVEDKPRGRSASNQNSPLCATCCRDHHDSGSTVATYRPYAPATDFDGDNHKHYRSDGQVALANDTYVEACRMKRVDGRWRVVPDWNLVYLTVLPCDHFLNTGEVDGNCPPTAPTSSATVAAYASHTMNVVNDFFVAVDANDANVKAYQPTRQPIYDIRNAAHDVSPGKQLISRGIYADVIFDVNNPRQVDGNWLTYVAGLPVSERLALIPFYDVNTTLLSKWSPSSQAQNPRPVGSCLNTTASWYQAPADINLSSATVVNYASSTWPTPASPTVCVTNEPISTIADAAGVIYYTAEYSRGLLVQKDSSTDARNFIATYLSKYNHGLTNTARISGTDSFLTSAIVARSFGLQTKLFEVSFTGFSGNQDNSAARKIYMDNVAVTWRNGTQNGQCTVDVTGQEQYVCNIPPGDATEFKVAVGNQVVVNKTNVSYEVRLFPAPPATNAVATLQHGQSSAWGNNWFSLDIRKK